MPAVPVARARRALLLAVSLVAVLVPATASASTLVQYPVSIDVSMRVQVAETFESISKCTPGENGSVTYTYDFESDAAGVKGGIKNTTLSLLDGEGGTGFSLGEQGGAVESGKAGSWELSKDDCVDPNQVQVPDGVSSPTCKTLKGKVWAGIVLDLSSTGDDELAPLSLGDGKLSIKRWGGGAQNRACQRLIQNTVPAANTDFDLGIGLSSIGGGKLGAADTFTIVLPKVKNAFLKLSSGKTRFSQRFNVSGPCYAMTGSTRAVQYREGESKGNVGPVFGIPRYETCAVSGSGVVIVTRRGKVRRTTIPGSVKG